MGNLSEELLKLNLKERKFSPVYLFFGDEDYTKKFYLKQFIKKAVGDNFTVFNLHFYNENTSIDEIGEAIQNFPMMNDYALHVVNNFNFKSCSKNKFRAFIDELNDFSIVIFYMYGEARGGKKGSGDENASSSDAMSFAAFKKYIFNSGGVIEFKNKDAKDLQKMVSSAAKKRGCYFSSIPLINSFITKTGNDINKILNETQKLCAYVGEGEITAETVNKLTSHTPDSTAFELTDAIVRNNAPRAFSLLNDLRSMETEPLAMLGAINYTYTDIYRVKVTVETGHQLAAIGNVYDFGANNWRANKAFNISKKLNLKQVKRSINVLADADRLLKTSNNDGYTVIDETLIKLMLIAAKG